MSYGVLTASDQKMAFVYSEDMFSKSVAKTKMFFYERGAYREDRLNHLSLCRLRQFIKLRIDSQGWNRLGSLSGDLATKRFLEYCGFRDVYLYADGVHFSCSVAIFGMKLDRETFELPAWLQLFLWQEKQTNRAGLSNQALLSTCDSAELLYQNWLYLNNRVTAEQIAEGAIATARIDIGAITTDRNQFNQAADKRIEAELVALGIT